MIKLNLGCGQDYREGYVNTDWSHKVKADYHFDLDDLPYPFPNGCADEVIMISSLEHTRRPQEIINEVHRILAPGGLFVVHVPYFKSDGAFQALEHHCYWSEKSFDYICDPSKYPMFEGPEFEFVEPPKLTTVGNTPLTFMRNLIPFRKHLRHILWNMYDEVQFKMRKV